MKEGVREMNSKIRKFLNVPTIIASVVIMASLIFAGYLYYRNGELTLLKNHFNLYIIFTALVLWVIGILFYKIFSEMKQQTKAIVQMQQMQVTLQQNHITLKQNDEDITTLLRVLIDEQLTNHHELTNLHLNSRNLLLEYINNKTKE